ncbi:FAD-dependent oxidoreductase [Actinosynnema sp. NPDC047251]|uniref:NAD(P)/FAD-dependent oxidoreductase n=1 Tax=Saccharothrix espanaensis TaxID=103731 RepID=UPI00030DEDE7|nr:FAD-dependent oxidoreductase [Saccharothrix espanaensis]
MRNEERVVIAGGGLAGLRAGERLRELGFRGEVVIVSAERHLPYHRPALSKEAINGELHASDLRLSISRELNAIWRLGTAATHLEPDRRIVGLPGGEELGYDGLIIATGVEPRHLQGAPRQDQRIHVLRTVDDAIAIKRAINSTQGLVVVVGGGLIGCEMAASVKSMGRDVAIVSRSSTLLGSAVGKNIADTVTEAHRARGVRMAMGVKIRHWMPQAGGVAIHLSDGQVFFAAVVVIAVGASPSVAWLRGSGLVLDDGVLCEPTCHVVGGTDIVAAGDVAQWPNLRFGGRPRRVEHWLNAVEMGRAAAENLLAGREGSRPFTPVPRFWTEQYGMRIQGSGLPSMGKDTTTLAGSRKDHRTITGFVDDGRLVGMVGLDAPTAMIKLSTELWRQNRVVGVGADGRRPQHLVPPERLAESGVGVGAGMGVGAESGAGAGVRSGREAVPVPYDAPPVRFEAPAPAAGAGAGASGERGAGDGAVGWVGARAGLPPADRVDGPSGRFEVPRAQAVAQFEEYRLRFEARARAEKLDPERYDVPRQQQESQPLPVPPAHAPVVRTRSHPRPLVRTGPRARPR